MFADQAAGVARTNRQSNRRRKRSQLYRLTPVQGPGSSSTHRPSAYLGNEMVLARSGSFTETAQKMGVTQSAISHSLKNLETAIDCKLFHRSGRNLNLTSKGRDLLSEIEESLLHLSSALEHASAPERWGSGKLRIGIEHLLSEHLIRDILLELQSLFPLLKCEFTSDYTPELLELLEHDKLDIVAGILPPGESPRKTLAKKETFISEEELLLFVPGDHSALKGQPFQWEKQKSIIIMTCGRPEEDYIHSYLSHFTKAPPTRHHITSESTFRELILSGMGIGIGSPWMLKKEISDQTIGTLRIPNEGLKRRWTIFSNAKTPSPASLSFESLFKRGFEAVAKLPELNSPQGAVNFSI